MAIRKVITAVVALLSFTTALAQDSKLIPQDPAVKVGHLDNGLTYYIRHNAYPEGKADFFIVDKVGSLQEEESQRGLAHLLEHLAFNGSDHFEGNGIFKFAEAKGGSFDGRTDLTSTYYSVNDIPTTNPLVVDSCLLILKDWANGITLNSKSIEDERDVVHNEYRLRMKGGLRILTDNFEAIYPGSTYGRRMPIGLMSVIDGCSPDTLRAYYNKWYHPDNQALIIVGDIDADKIEAKIKELFAGIVTPANVPKVSVTPVPDNKEAIYVVGKDKELESDNIMIEMKHDTPSREEMKSVSYLRKDYIYGSIAFMLDSRASEKSNEADCPFTSASYGEQYYMGIEGPKRSFAISVSPKQGKDVEAYIAALTLARQAADYGFTQTEYERSRASFMSSWENAYLNRNKMKNNEFTDSYKSNFCEGLPIPSVEQQYNIYQEMVPEVTLQEINDVAKKLINMNDYNFVTVAMLVDKDSITYPTEAQFAAAKAQVCAARLTAYVDNVKQEPLIPEMPKAGKVVKTTENKTLDYKLLTLSNGAKVVLKKTNYQDSEIKMSAFAKGGYLSVPEARCYEAECMAVAANVSGLGNFSHNELMKALAGKKASVSCDINARYHGLSGNTTPKDIETMMQLIYLKMTNVTKDEKNFESFREEAVTGSANQSHDAQQVFADSIRSTIYNGTRSQRNMTSEDYKALNYDAMLKDIKDYYGNARDFTFIFVGNIDEDVMLPLINKYIASLPNNGKTFKNSVMPLFKGEKKNVFTMAMGTPNSHNQEFWLSDLVPDTQRSHILVSLAGKLLDKNYFDVLREQLSATYTPWAHGTTEESDEGIRYAIAGGAMLNPDKSDMALPYFIDGIKKVSTDPDAKDFASSKEELVNAYDTSIKDNSWWSSNIEYYLKSGIDMITGYKATVSSIQPKDVTDFINNIILKSGNHAQILLKAVKE